MKLMSNLEDTRPFTAMRDRHDDGIVSRSAVLCDALDRVGRVAPMDTTVMLMGETGTGKELMARVLHRRSRRAARPMVAANLASIPEALVASELFGHEQGAFTGASQRRIGRFEVADRGTLFLDEVGELSPALQVALLRVLQEGEFERLGSSQTRKVDVRLITATNRDLEQLVEDRGFRADLFYRLSVFPIRLPPLRDRREDVPLLAHYFLEHIAERIGRTFDGIDQASLERLEAFSWPGNIRQLQNVIEHSAILCDSQKLCVPADLLVEKNVCLTSGSRLDTTLQMNELHMIERALQEADGRVSGRTGAAARLGLPPSTLESKIRRLHIDKLHYRAARID
jgi:transcriptional regulator with GAF, ATPase, and Fis domain